jgi:branched-chain amino acid aminotransferase
MGATVTDFCRTFKHVLFRWPDHLARFRRGCGTCFIPLLQGDDELTRIAEELVRHNAALIGPSQELALITFATPGPIGYYLGEPGGAGDGPPTLGMHTFPLRFERYRKFFEEGVALQITGGCQLAPEILLPVNVKHRSRLHWWLADRQSSPGTVPMALNSSGSTVTETAFANFLLVHNGTIVSPPPEFILDGISKWFVYLLASDLGIPFIEEYISPDDCQFADEAMLCGTAFCLAGVRRIDRLSIPWPGPVFTRLLAAWSERVGLDIARQILANP